MVTLEGHQWKALRSIFNPGFNAGHLMTVVPYIVDSTLVFVDIMKEKAKEDKLLSMDVYTTRLTIDIIGKVALDADFDSQLRPHPIVTTFRKQVSLMPSESTIGPLENINLVRSFRVWWNGRKLDALVGAELDKRVAYRQSSQDGTIKSSSTERKRSIVDLALDAYEKETRESKEKGTSSGMSSSFRASAIDSVKTFIFAGHDTTSATLSYTLYLLHLHPPVQQKLVAELDAVFGPSCDASSIAASIKSDPHCINKLEYLTAIVKEVLRLFPPASTLRQFIHPSDGKDAFLIDPKSQQSYPLTNFLIWPVAHMIHRNADFFPDPIAFIPERFIPAQTPFPDAKLFTPAGKDAWRPFEKGPRNCIGQELAMIESKVVLAMICKEFDFVPEYSGQEIHSWTPWRRRWSSRTAGPGARG